MGPCRCGRVGILAVLLAAAGAAADEPELLVRARGEAQALDLEAAARTLDRALAAGGNGPSDLREIHRLAGQVAASSDRRAEAEEHFRRLLVLDPAARLRPGLSPKIVGPFEAARRWLEAHGPLALRLETRGREVVLAIVSDPLAMVARARLVYRTADGVAHTSEAPAAPRVALALPAGGSLAVTVAALDERGNRLADLEATVAEDLPTPSGPAPSPPSPEGRSLVRHPLVWGGAAALFAGGAVVFGLRLRDTQAELDDRKAHSPEIEYASLEGLEARGRREALVTNVGIALAGACAATAIVFLVLDRRDPAEGRIGLGPGGLFARGRF